MRSFEPPRRILMGPGPSDVSPRVLAALSRPTIGHLDPAFQALMEEIKAALGQVMKAPDHACVPLPAPGTAGMEAAMMNLLEPGETAVIAVNGQFGERLADMAGRAGAEVVRVDFDWGTPVDADRVAPALTGRKVKLLAFVHAETSTGTRTDPKPLCDLAQAAGALTVVDCVTSLGGIDVDVVGWGADVIYSGTQKCLSAPPGLSPFAMSADAQAAIAARREKSRSWLLDMSLMMGYWDAKRAAAPTTIPRRSTPSTACTRRWSSCWRKACRPHTRVTAGCMRRSSPAPRPPACRSWSPPNTACRN